ncbi:MAG TPA: hypothetical protein VNO24_06810 [Blastocatellia bacterium]|nr:hypothetical protein [Blastocatellia bacterium]
MSEEELNKSGADDKPILDAESKGSIVRGVGEVLLFHLLQIPLAFMTSFLSLAVICVSQLAYVIPAIIVARRKGHEETVKGIIIAASVSALLNIACTGYVFYGLKWQ